MRICTCIKIFFFFFLILTRRLFKLANSFLALYCRLIITFTAPPCASFLFLLYTSRAVCNLHPVKKKITSTRNNTRKIQITLGSVVYWRQHLDSNKKKQKKKRKWFYHLLCISNSGKNELMLCKYHY